jgi:hypothetical protein
LLLIRHVNSGGRKGSPMNPAHSAHKSKSKPS